MTHTLIDIISKERLEGYRRRLEKAGRPSNRLDCYASYNWNIALSASFYSSLQALEVSLRNTIHHHASNHFQSDTWFKMPGLLFPKEQKKIDQAISVLKDNKKNPSPGRILAELSFGFWTSLFNTRYDQILWHPLIKRTFPFMDARNRTRKVLSKRLNQIRWLRNRIYHYEPIWYYRDLKDHHARIIETINWIEPNMKKMIMPIDTFHECSHPDKLVYIKSQLIKDHIQ